MIPGGPMAGGVGIPTGTGPAMGGMAGGGGIGAGGGGGFMGSIMPFLQGLGGAGGQSMKEQGQKPQLAAPPPFQGSFFGRSAQGVAPLPTLNPTGGLGPSVNPYG